ncbi:MAG: DUF3237 domain-containing protein [Rhodospirillaceae bacterium]|jgi:hypothetical protein|nr:DUF3237 domain-containing protein [Rhodospirillaceae bacterium]MBT3490859.1 DUF3237 domain-containing protein [Rhodospirillaceae bacterium]MBT3778696.1 DUF3237 domain-containing protein [Rhodospirillaceae bacterium]MBT3976647.1 DUF3237 domain-containing protein [Rhodospirillaceae bacterium]MBT4171191.1 DUF3237 domain-containing protein [Rhodospirillaceae bacterium]
MAEPLPLNSSFLFNLDIELEPPLVLGSRRIVIAKGGRVEGTRISGRVLSGGGDWIIARSEDISLMDIRVAFETDDSAPVFMSCVGRRVVTADIAVQLTDREKRGALDPSRYYVRILPTFETADERYLWLNGIVGVGIGRYTSTGVSFDVHEIL